jgi:hypothetical protein
VSLERMTSHVPKAAQQWPITCSMAAACIAFPFILIMTGVATHFGLALFARLTESKRMIGFAQLISTAIAFTVAWLGSMAIYRAFRHKTPFSDEAGGVKMHWFRRTTIATVFASTCGVLMLAALEEFYTFGWKPYPSLWHFGFSASIVWILPTSVLTAAAYALLTWRYGPRRVDTETRCRKCAYILRGITELRCPECGEAI